jgi:hypothetical protein
MTLRFELILSYEREGSESHEMILSLYNHYLITPIPLSQPLPLPLPLSLLSEYRIPMSQQTLFLEDKCMMDPLSLMDYPGIIVIMTITS